MEESNHNTTLVASQQRELVGQVIAGKYKIERLIESGGMGAIYEGQHLILERTIAIKLLHGHIADNESAPIRFLREAKTTAKLEHPNAITIYDFGVLQDNVGFIVMEYIRGRSLRQWLTEHARFSPAQTVEWLGQACEAVAAAHSQGIVHRDLKPENIMIKEAADGTLVVKVVDFGLAKIMSSDGTHITKTGDVIGTPYYMAPECCDGEHVDHRVDIYALGIIAYEMLTGTTPFTGSVHDIFVGHMFQEAEPIDAINPDVPAAFNEVIRRAIAKRPDQRYSSALELAAALKIALEPADALCTSSLNTIELPRPEAQLWPWSVMFTSLLSFRNIIFAVAVTFVITCVGMMWMTLRIQNATLREATAPTPATSINQQLNHKQFEVLPARPAKKKPDNSSKKTVIDNELLKGKP